MTYIEFADAVEKMMNKKMKGAFVQKLIYGNEK